MNKPALPPLDDELVPRKRVNLKAIRPAAVDDQAIADNSHKIGSEWGANTALAPLPAPKPPPRAPSTSLRIEVPDYLDRALAFRAVELRTTKQYLVIKALKEAGYPVEDIDLVEDRRKVRKPR